MYKQIGKIKSVHIGIGGYDDAQFGVWFYFVGEDMAVGAGDGFWIDQMPGCEWTEEDRIMFLGKEMVKLIDVLQSAKVKSVNKLVGKPVEVTLDNPNGRVIDWRILTEVL